MSTMRIDGVYDDLPTVRHAVDDEGFVLVGGHRVPTHPNGSVPLHSLPTYLSVCACCFEPTAKPLRVVAEYAPLIRTLRYFQVPVPGASPYCTRCRLLLRGNNRTTVARTRRR